MVGLAPLDPPYRVSLGTPNGRHDRRKKSTRSKSRSKIPSVRRRNTGAIMKSWKSRLGATAGDRAARAKLRGTVGTRFADR
jgi:hypothetical protein